MVYIGIDPGKDGGIAILDPDDMAKAVVYTNANLFMALTTYRGAKVMLEQVHAMPKQSPKSMFSFGESYGYIKGMLDALMVRYQTVPPRVWKKEFSLNADKKQSIKVCRRLFPLVDLRRTERCKTDHDGMAEALLIAEYARRKMK